MPPRSREVSGQEHDLPRVLRLVRERAQQRL
jgi:hypothetical protein